mgnify:CR=1 FL=1
MVVIVRKDGTTIPFEGYASGGQIPRQTVIGGQSHHLAYINPAEAELLKSHGGSGEPGPGGVPAYRVYDGGYNPSTIRQDRPASPPPSSAGPDPFDRPTPTPPPSSAGPDPFDRPPSSGSESSSSSGSGSGSESSSGQDNNPNRPTPPKPPKPPKPKKFKDSKGKTHSTKAAARLANTNYKLDEQAAARKKLEDEYKAQAKEFAGQLSAQRAAAAKTLAKEQAANAYKMQTAEFESGTPSLLGGQGDDTLAAEKLQTSFNDFATADGIVSTVDPLSTIRPPKRPESDAEGVTDTRNGLNINKPYLTQAGNLSEAGKFGQDYNGDGIISLSEKMRDMTDGGGAGYTDTRALGERQYYTAGGTELKYPGILGAIPGVADSLTMGFTAGFGSPEQQLQNLMAAGYSEEQAQAYLSQTRATLEAQEQSAGAPPPGGDTSPQPVVPVAADPCPEGYVMDPETQQCVVAPAVAPDPAPAPTPTPTPAPVDTVTPRYEDEYIGLNAPSTGLQPIVNPFS